MHDDDDDRWQEYKDDLAMGRIYEDGTQRDPEPPEPTCYTCADTRRLWVTDDATLERVDVTNCPDCAPTPEQVAAREAEYVRAVAAGEIDPNTDPWF